jgi:hypothetical protein
MVQILNQFKIYIIKSLHKEAVADEKAFEFIIKFVQFTKADDYVAFDSLFILWEAGIS